MASAPASGAVDVAELRRACSLCSLRDLCLPVGIRSDELRYLESLVETVGPMQTSEHLFRQGDSFTSLYAVKSGCVKTYTDSEDGSEQVLGFHLPGEIVGLDAIHTNRHRCSAVALDTAMACRLPFRRLNDLCQKVEGLQIQLLRVMSRDLDASHALSADHSVEERVGAFLLGFADRMSARGFSRSQFRLPMSRHDIANYLRLATETVSRTLTGMEEAGLIEVNRRDITLRDRQRLERLCPGELRL